MSYCYAELDDGTYVQSNVHDSHVSACAQLAMLAGKTNKTVKATATAKGCDLSVVDNKMRQQSVDSGCINDVYPADQIQQIGFTGWRK